MKKGHSMLEDCAIGHTKTIQSLQRQQMRECECLLSELDLSLVQRPYSVERNAVSLMHNAMSPEQEPTASPVDGTEIERAV